MPSTHDDLLKDPLFQLNMLLWLAQPLPAGNEISPLLYRRGFTVYAIAPLLPLPLDVRQVVHDTLALQSGVRPDIVLVHNQERKFAFHECKTNSFGPDSSTAAQIRSLLIISGSRAAEILGLQHGNVSASLSARRT